MFSSIRARTTAVFAVTVALLMALAIGGLVYYARHTAERNAAAVLSAGRAKISRELGEEHEGDDSSRLIAEMREELSSENLSLFLVGQDGRVVEGSQRPPSSAPLTDRRFWRTARLPIESPSGDTPQRPKPEIRNTKYETPEGSPSGKPSHGPKSEIRNTRYGDASHSPKSKIQNPKSRMLVVALPWSETESSLRSLAKTLALFGAFVVIVATVGAWVLVGRTLSPIGKLSSQANTATVKGLMVRLEEPSRDAEIVGLVATLNGLLGRLSETAAAKGRFYSAASHELRTPLQALSGHLELALNKVRTPEEYRSAMEEAYQQTRRLIKLTHGLLLLYQLDTNGEPRSETADLAAICRDTLAELEPTAAERGLHVATDLPERAIFSSPATHAEILVRNLLENAVRYADAGGEVKVSLDPLSDRLTLRIYNDAALPSDWNPAPLFEPFARPDASRSADTGGAGLGLAICKTIAHANGWELSLAKEPGGVIAILTVPPAEAE